MENSQTMPVGTVTSWYGDLSGNFDDTGKGIGKMAGWALCNGNNNAPNLMDCFIVGAGHDYALNAAGGNNAIKLSIDQMPSHTHSIDPAGGHNHTFSKNCSDMGNSYEREDDDGRHPSCWGSSESPTTSFVGDHTHAMQSAGSNADIDIRPKFYALYYIMNIG